MITKQYTVWCDRCGNWDQLTGSMPQAKKEWKRLGWKFKRTGDGLDLCPLCIKNKE